MANKIIRINYNPIGGANNASGVTYDDTTTNLGVDNLQEAIEAVDTRIDSSDVLIAQAQDDIDQLQSDVISLDSRLDDTESDITDLQNADTTINARITTVEGNLSQEVTNRTSADTALQGLITAEQTRATGAESTLSGSIATVQSNLTDHLNDTTDAHLAGSIGYIGTRLAGTTVKAAIDELAALPKPSTGDIEQTSFALANNASNQPVTGFVFAPGSVRAFKALVSVAIFATTPTYCEFEISGIRVASDYFISYESTGNTTGLTFDITSAGQVTYSLQGVTGFSSGVIKFRAIVTNI